MWNLLLRNRLSIRFGSFQLLVQSHTQQHQSPLFPHSTEFPHFREICWKMGLTFEKISKHLLIPLRQENVSILFNKIWISGMKTLPWPLKLRLFISTAILQSWSKDEGLRRCLDIRCVSTNPFIQCVQMSQFSFKTVMISVYIKKFEWDRFDFAVPNRSLPVAWVPVGKHYALADLWEFHNISRTNPTESVLPSPHRRGPSHTVILTNKPHLAVIDSGDERTIYPRRKVL